MTIVLSARTSKIINETWLGFLEGLSEGGLMLAVNRTIFNTYPVVTQVYYTYLPR